MARGDSIIRVSIIGDASKLIKAAGQADAATGGLLKSTAKVAGGALLGLGVIDKAFDTISGGLEKADTFEDAFTRLAGTITPAFAQSVKDIAFDFTNIGLSADEVGTLAVKFADLATAAGVSAPLIATMTPDMLKLSAAIAATTGKTLDEVVDDIGKAAQGQQRPVSEYGILIDKALNPDAQILSIFDQLKAKYPDVISATNDLVGSQDTLNAKWDNFTIRLGLALDGPLKGVVDVFTKMIDDDIPQIIDGLGDMGDHFTAWSVAAGKAIRSVLDLLGQVGRAINQTGGPFGTGLSEREVTFAQRRENERNGLPARQGGP